jgi:hypothetical protein
MEASAFIQLCEHFGSEYAKCLGVVKGISDFGNSEKGKDESAYGEALKSTGKKFIIICGYLSYFPIYFTVV